MSKFLIAGLGNIGEEYQLTRHNIGFEVADAFLKSLSTDDVKSENQFKSDKLAFVNHSRFKGKQLVVIKPTTYMNLSGKAVKYWMDKEKIALENILVVVDDLALPLSKLRVRPGGSDAGHNGLKSIQEIVGTSNYPKLRFGIGNDFPKGHQSDYVLGKWKKDEGPLIKLKIEIAASVIEDFAVQGIAAAMNRVNNQDYSL